MPLLDRVQSLAQIPKIVLDVLELMLEHAQRALEAGGGGGRLGGGWLRRDWFLGTRHGARVYEVERSGGRADAVSRWST